jgi:hypothetical protein
MRTATATMNRFPITGRAKCRREAAVITVNPRNRPWIPLAARANRTSPLPIRTGVAQGSSDRAAGVPAVDATSACEALCPWRGVGE